MKTLLLAAALLALPVAAQAGYGIDAQMRQLRCFGSIVGDATEGRFPLWVLPGSSSRHLRPGQHVDENCQVQGAPTGRGF